MVAKVPRNNCGNRAELGKSFNPFGSEATFGDCRFIVVWFSSYGTVFI